MTQNNNSLARSASLLPRAGCLILVLAACGCGVSSTQTIAIDLPSGDSTDTVAATNTAVDEPVSVPAVPDAAPESSGDNVTLNAVTLNAANAIEDTPPAATETPKPSVNNPPVRNLTPSTDEDDESMRVRPRSTFRRGGIRDLTFDNLEFEIERDADFNREMLGEKIEELDGKNVIIRGFILAASVFQQKGIKEFVLIRDNQECCFGPGAYIYHNIQVNMDEGQTTDFKVRPVTLEGKLTIKPWIGPDDRCYSVFHIQGKKCK